MKNKLIVFLLAAVLVTLLSISAAAACPNNTCDWKKVEEESIVGDCETDTVDKYVCNNCGATKEVVTTAKGTHKWNSGKITTPATCAAEGVKTFTCTVSKCGATKTEPIAKKAHTWDRGTITTEPTCTEIGVKTFECTKCDETKTDDVQAKGHTWVKDTEHHVDATCTEGGTKAEKCSKCGETRSEATDPLEHNDVLVSTSATCTAAGVSTYQCSRCDRYDIREDKKLGHKTEKTGGPTCTESGKYITKCVREGCDYSVTDTKTTKALGHDVPETGTNAWKVTKAATCETEGTRRGKCTRCKEYVYEEIEKTDHDYSSEYLITKVPTSSTTGKYKMTCEDCGATTSKTIAKGTTNLTKYTVPPVTASVEGGVVEKGTTVKLSCELSGATIYYTINGKSPITSTSRIKYTSAIELTETCTIKAYAVYDKDDDIDASSVITETYVVKEPEPEEIVQPDVTIKMTIEDGFAYVNGEKKVLDAVPVIKNDRTMLPIRFVAETLGAVIGWDDATRTVTIVSKSTVIKIVVDQKFATVDGKKVELDSPSYIDPKTERTYLPVRFVAENLGAEVGWDDATRTVTLKK